MHVFKILFSCFRDSIIVSAGDCLTSIFGGIVIFSFIGYMAHVLQAPIDSVATQGRQIIIF